MIYRMNKKFVAISFFILVCLSLLSPLWVFKDLLFPYVTSKAFYFRICIELALPFYLYLLAARPELRPSWKKQPLNWLMVAFLLLNLISALSGVAVVRSLWGNFERMGGVYYLAHLILLYFYVLMIAQMGGSYLKRFLQIFLAAAMIVTINGIFGKLGLPILVQDPSLPARVSSTLGNPIYVGSFLIVPLFLSVYFALQAEENYKKILYYLSALLFLICIFLSGTRGALVGLVGGGFLAGAAYVFLNSNRKIKLWGSALVLSFAVIAGIGFTYSNHLPEGSVVKRLLTLKDSNTEARLIQWGVALKGYKDHPLFGVGSENYYFIANKYYNPAIYNYDRSWFDKPHNYLIEVLVTTGAFGFAAYLGLLVFLGVALYRGFKNGFLSLAEFCVLLAALLVYQIQNLTVFDTVPASLTFYCFAGFAGYIWDASSTVNIKSKPERKKNILFADNGFPTAVFSVGLLVMAYLIYATNIVPMEVGKRINYGFAYSSVDQAKADGYFQDAFSLPFNFDQTESAAKYAEFAQAFGRTSTPANQALATKVENEAIDALNNALAVEPTYPILWQNLAGVYLYKGVQDGKVISYDPRAQDAIQKAIDLSPGREEAYLTQVQIYGVQGKISQAEDVIKTLMQRFPKDSSLYFMLANLYRSDNKIPDAVKLMEQAQLNGYQFASYSDMQWLVAYYAGQKQYDKAMALLLAQAQKEPGNYDLFSDTVKVYAMEGQKDQAINLAKQIMSADPTRAKEMQAIIDSLSQAQPAVKK